MADEAVPFPGLPEEFNENLKDENGAPMSKRWVSVDCVVASIMADDSTSLIILVQ